MHRCLDQDFNFALAGLFYKYRVFEILNLKSSWFLFDVDGLYSKYFQNRSHGLDLFFGSKSRIVFCQSEILLSPIFQTRKTGVFSEYSGFWVT